MHKLIIKTAFLGLALFVILQSCKKSSTPEPEVVVPDDQTFSQSFESMSDAINQGWVFRNLSDDVGYGWSVEDETLFYGDQPFDGSKLLYGNYQASLAFGGNISDWAISPKLLFQNGDKISFYALSNGAVDGFPDRLQLRLNTFNTSDSIGETSTDIGKFTKPLIDINPLYKATDEAFPYSWTKYEATITGLNKPDSGRFALRYFVELHDGANGDELAVDKVEFTSANH